MSNVVKPPPAGTKETADYVPAVKVSSMKSMFEQPKSASSPKTATPPPRGQLRSEDWANGNEDSEDKNETPSQTTVAEGSYEDRGGIIRPPSAGTKERPAYNLSSNFLKSRAALFDAPAPKQYAPRNTIKADVRVETEVVNAQSETSDLEYQLSTSLKDTKKRFEDGDPVTPERQETNKYTEVVQTEKGEIIRPPAAGTRDDSDIVPAANLKSVKSIFESKQEDDQKATSKEPVDVSQKNANDIQEGNISIEVNQARREDKLIQQEDDETSETKRDYDYETERQDDIEDINAQAVEDEETEDAVNKSPMQQQDEEYQE